MMTPSATSTPSITQSLSRTASATGSPSQSHTPSSTSSFSSTPSQSLSPSLTQSPTPSTSRAPFALLFSAPDSAAPFSGIDTLGVSDASPLIRLSPWLSRCPYFDFVGRVTCSAPTAAAGTPPDGRAAATLLSTSPTTTAAAACDPASAAPLRLSPTLLKVGAAYLTGPGEATLSCSVSDAQSGGVVARVAVPLVVSGALWPVWEDALVLSDGGVLTSASQGWAMNVTATLLEAARAAGGNDTDVALSTSLAIPAAVISAVATALAQWPVLPNASVGGQSEFSLTLNGQARLILRSASQLRRAFAPGMAVTLGAAACTVQGVSEPGDLLLMTTPFAAAVCPSASAAGVECGHVTLGLDTTSAGDASGGAVVGAALTCPPFCPGAVGAEATVQADGGYGPIPLDSGTISLGWIPPRSALGAAALPSAAAAPPLSSSVGIYYALQCFQTGAFTDPSSGACGSVGIPASYSCAFGSGDACRLCPSNALCPGGFRMWPRAGAWASSESDGSVLPCAPPDAQSRCLGWNVTTGAAQYGPGYLQGSYLCGSCSAAFYGDSDGACRACPVLSSPWQRYSGVVYIAVGIVALVAVVWAGLALMVRLRGGTLAGGARHMLAFAVWALQAAQVVSNAGAVTAASLPPLMRRLYSAVAALQLEGVLLPPACTGAYPFEQEAALMALALGCWGGACLAYYCSPKSCICGALSPALLRQAGRVALVCALVLFSPVSGTAVKLLFCEAVTMSPAGVAALNGGGSVVVSAASPGTSIRVSTLVSNPFFVCWARGGAHLPVGVLAAVTLAAYVLTLPVLTLWWALADRAARCESERGVRVDVGTGGRRVLQGCFCTRSGEGSLPSPHSRGTRLTSGKSSFGDSSESAMVTTQNPLRQGHPAGRMPSQGDPSSSGAALPGTGIAPVDPLVAPLVADFTPAAFYTKWVDLSLLLLLSLLGALMPRPATVLAIAEKAAIACAAIIAVALHVAVARPYPRRDAWKGWVRFLLLLDAAGCVAMNAAVTLQDYGLSSATVNAAARSGAFALFAACVLTLAVLLCGVTASAYWGLVEEADAKAAAAASAAAGVAAVQARGRLQPSHMPATLVVPGASNDAERGYVRSTTSTIDEPACSLPATAPRIIRRAPLARRLTGSVSALEQLQRERQTSPGRFAAADDAAYLNAVTRIGVGLRSGRVDVKAAASSVRPLVAALQGAATSSGVWAAACDALVAAISIGDDDGVAIADITAALFEAGAAPTLLDVLARSDGDELQSQAQLSACTALAHLAHTPLGAASIVAPGGLGALAALLSRPSASPESVTAACAPLAALAMHHDNPAHVAALTSAGTMEAVAGALARLAASSLSVQDGPTASASVFPQTPSSRTAVETAAALVTNATVDEGALARFIAAGGAPPLLALLAGASANGDASLVCSLAAAVCSVAVSSLGAGALAAAGAAELLFDALAAETTTAAGPSAPALEPLCWSLQGVSGALLRAAAEPAARPQAVALAERGMPLLRTVLASAVFADEGGADHAAARARALMETLEIIGARFGTAATPS